MLPPAPAIATCLIHLGELAFPQYVLDAIDQLHVSNPHVPIYMLCNEAVAPRLRTEIERLDVDSRLVEVVVVEDLPDSSTYRAFRSTHQLDDEFRGGFWRFTSERFFVLEAFMRARGGQHIFHIENDMMVYTDLSEVAESMPDWVEIAVTKDAPGRVIPGLLFAKSAGALRALNRSLLDQARRGANDMQSLGRFTRENPKDVLQLPIMVPWYDRGRPELQEYTRWFWRFGCVFDGAALGQYLGGIDPRNTREGAVTWARRGLAQFPPWIRKLAPGRTSAMSDHNGAASPNRPFLNETTVFRCNRLDFDWRIDADDPETPLRRPVFTVRDSTINRTVPIANLHIHSKKLHLFTSRVTIGFDEIITGERLQSLADVSLIPKEIQRYHKRILSRLGRSRVVARYDGLSARDMSLLNGAQSLFVYTHELPAFIRYLWPRLSGGPYVLVTHNSDHEVSDQLIDWADSAGDKLKLWFAQNVRAGHDKIVPIPIGVANSQFPHGDLSALCDRLTAGAKMRRRELVNARFSVGTHARRAEILSHLTANLPPGAIAHGSRISWEEYLDELSVSWFSACPRGNGIDTHRFWESLYFGAIPLVEPSWHSRYWAEAHAIPAYMVSDWQALLADDLMASAALVEPARFDLLPALRLSYWKALISAGTRPEPIHIPGEE